MGQTIQIYRIFTNTAYRIFFGRNAKLSSICPITLILITKEHNIGIQTYVLGAMESN